MKKIISILIFLTTSLLYANDLTYGLYFKSYSSLGKDRTSLILNDNKPLAFKDEITISFDMFIRKETVFGNIVRVVNDAGEAITLNFSADEKDNRYPSIIMNDRFYPISNVVEPESWFPVRLRIITQQDSLYLDYNNIHKSYKVNFSKWKNVRIAFGTCSFPGFETYEVAPINIKDVKIYDKQKLIRHWALKEHNDIICYDLLNNIAAISENPQWLIDTHTNWTEIYSINFDNSNNPQYAHNNKKDLIYLVPDQKSIIVYNLQTKKDSVIYVKDGYPAGISTNELIYDYLNDELVSYSLDEKTISRFSFKDATWSKKTPCKTETGYWHHTISFNEKDTTLVAFGGYGYYQYKNDLFKVSLNKATISDTKVLDISPRYSPASVIVDNKLYIFGGRGSESGKQEVNPHYNYDFHSIDLLTDKVELLWKTNVDLDFLPCGNLIFNSEDSCFYFLTNIDNGTLCSIKRESSEIKKVSNGIDQRIAVDFLFYTLYYSPIQKKIYALFSSNLKTGSSKIVVYEIDYPPLSYAEISQTPSDKNNKLYTYALISICILLLLISLLYLIIKNKRTPKRLGIYKPKNEETDAKSDVLIIEKNALKSEEGRIPVNVLGRLNEEKFVRSKQCISLLGGFNVMDRNGNNITQNFTPILKNLLLLILLYSENEEKGIKDSNIDSILWADKDRKAARNNRNVSLTRLKLLLENVGNITLTNNNGFWKLSLDDVFCDYYESIRHTKQVKENNGVNETVKIELIQLLKFGPLLPYTETEWIDKFKSNYSNDAIDILYEILTSQDVINNDDFAIEIVDIMFLFDSLNEEALKIKCFILYNSGKKSLSKTTYDIFTKEYKALLGEEYKYTLAQVLEQARNL